MDIIQNQRFAKPDMDQYKAVQLYHQINEKMKPSQTSTQVPSYFWVLKALATIFHLEYNPHPTSASPIFFIYFSRNFNRNTGSSRVEKNREHEEHAPGTNNNLRMTRTNSNGVSSMVCPGWTRGRRPRGSWWVWLVVPDLVRNFLARALVGGLVYTATYCGRWDPKRPRPAAYVINPLHFSGCLPSIQ